ncbi:MAG: phosphodiester glycosidase family protein [Planctomycetota bacterium]
MRRPRVIVFVLIAALVTGLCYWRWGVKRWSGITVDRHNVADGIELAICEFEHPDRGQVTIYLVKASFKAADFKIDFSGPDQAVIRPDFIATGRGQQAAAMVNGGYFDASFQPVGLVVKDGQTISEMSNQPALSGVLAVFDSNDLLLIPRSKYRADSLIRSAIQAGPFIVDPGGKMGIRSDDLKRAKRTAVGQTNADEVVFISTTACTLYEFSEILTEHYETFDVTGFDRVLNLDGGPSTGFYLHDLEKHQAVPETEIPNRVLMLKRRR